MTVVRVTSYVAVVLLVTACAKKDLSADSKNRRPLGEEKVLVEQPLSSAPRETKGLASEGTAAGAEGLVSDAAVRSNLSVKTTPTAEARGEEKTDPMAPDAAAAQAGVRVRQPEEEANPAGGTALATTRSEAPAVPAHNSSSLASGDAAKQLEMERRQARLEELREWGDSGTPQDLQRLLEVIEGDSSPSDRVMAIRALRGTGPDPAVLTPEKSALLPRFKQICTDSHIGIRGQCAILAHQWDQKEFALPILKEAAAMGVPVSEAFSLGWQDGRRLYAPEAEEFFVGLLDSPHQHIRLDTGLALLRMGKVELGMKPFIDGIKPGQPVNSRLMAVQYTAGIRDLPGILDMLRQASNDPDAGVAARARQLLESAPALTPK